MSGMFLRMALIAAAAVCAGQLIRGRAPALATGVSLAAVAALAAVMLPQARGAWEFFQQCLDQTGLDPELFTPVLKVVGVSQITQLTAELCRDAGERAVAAKVELCGAAASLVCVLPLARQALALIGALGT